MLCDLDMSRDRFDARIRFERDAQVFRTGTSMVDDLTDDPVKARGVADRGVGVRASIMVRVAESQRDDPNNIPEVVDDGLRNVVAGRNGVDLADRSVTADVRKSAPRVLDRLGRRGVADRQWLNHDPVGIDLRYREALQIGAPGFERIFRGRKARAYAKRHDPVVAFAHPAVSPVALRTKLPRRSGSSVTRTTGSPGSWSKTMRQPSARARSKSRRLVCMFSYGSMS